MDSWLAHAYSGPGKKKTSAALALGDSSDYDRRTLHARRHSSSSAFTWEPSAYLLNAFFLMALEENGLPLRWIDPRSSLQCGPATTVRGNGEPRIAGRTVPNQPLERARLPRLQFVWPALRWRVRIYRIPRGLSLQLSSRARRTALHGSHCTNRLQRAGCGVDAAPPWHHQSARLSGQTHARSENHFDPEHTGT